LGWAARRKAQRYPQVSRAFATKQTAQARARTPAQGSQTRSESRYNARAPAFGAFNIGGASCVQTKTSSTSTGFEVTSKRRKGYPSETQVKRGDRVVNGNKELLEKLGRNDPCPCGSGLRFQALLHVDRRARRFRPGPFLLGNECLA